jgi:dihydrofolate reductase
MRRIVMFNQVSADGYFATPDGSLDWVVPDDKLSQAAMDQGPAYDTVLFGRKTYDMFEKFWPHALDPSSSTAPDPHAPGRRSASLRDMAVFLNATSKVVFSRTRKDVTWKNSRLVRELDPRAIEDMKRQPGQDMILFGSGSIVSALTRAGLIDEYQFVVVPVVLGAGRPLFSGVDRLKLALIDAKGFESGNVLQRYKRAQ